MFIGRILYMKRVLMVLFVALVSMGLLASCATKSGTCSGAYVPVPPAVAAPAPKAVAPAPVVKAVPAPIVIYFDFDKATLRPSEQAKIEQAAKLLKDDPTATAVLEGNTDPIGAPGYNMSLGMARANTVKAALAAKGIDAKRLSAVSYGETKLVKPGLKGKANNEVNRRTVVVIKIQ
jgi:outer membrane protein OmpA-like peptidoglycan-associated protein